MLLIAEVSPALTGLAGVLVGGLISLLTFRATAHRLKINDLREQLLEIIDLRYQWRVLDRGEEGYARDALWLNRKRNVRLAMAMELARGLRRRMSTWDCMTLGAECDSNDEWVAARDYLELGVEKSKSESAITQAIALRHLADHYIQLGPEQDVSKGNQLYREAVSLTEHDARPFSVYTTGRTYYLWASDLKSVEDAPALRAEVPVDATEDGGADNVREAERGE